MAEQNKGKVSGGEGSLGFVLMVRHWPPHNKPARIAQPSVNGQSVRLEIGLDGRVEAEVGDPLGKLTARLRSRPMALDRPGKVMFMFTWKGQDCTLRVNGIDVGDESEPLLLLTGGNI